MPPKHHDADPNRSKVLAHIMENTGWDMGRTLAAFNSMRHPKCRVLVFDREHRMWKGCDWTPSDKSASEQMVLGELRVLQRRVMSMDGDLRRAEKDIEWLKRKLKSKKSEDDGQPEPESSENPINPNIESYSVELKNGPLTIYRDDGEPDNEWQRRKDHVLNQRVMFLNISGKSGTPEQEDYIKRMNFPPNKPPAKQANSLESIITQAWS